MSLAPVPLDTLNWGQIVTAIRSRIVADSSGSWTLHAPVDPGVTMLELLAWLLDQRIYWMAQTPDALSLATLSLLGMSPQPAKAAVTVLQLCDSEVPPRSNPVVSAGTLMQLADSDLPLLFAVDDGLALLPARSIGLTRDLADHSDDLRQHRPIALLSPGANAAQITILINLNSPIASTAVGQFCSLMIVLATPTDIVPAQWSGCAVADVPAPATLSWFYTSSKSGTTVGFSAAQVQDGTAGLRRSGIVRFPIPYDWQPEPQTADATTTTYKLLLQISAANFTYAPLLVALNPNVVLAHHAWQRTRQLTPPDWLQLPGNILSLTANTGGSSLKEYPPIEDTVTLKIVERDKTEHTWQRVDDLSLSGPFDRAFLLDRTHSEISFGNGLTGRLPVIDQTNPSAITVSYHAGGGSAGNVGERRRWAAQAAVDTDDVPHFTAVNLTSGDGGANSESLDFALQRARTTLNERNRAVSKPDYENLVMTTPGVGFSRAYAAVGHHPDFPCLPSPGAVTVFVVPYAPREGNADWTADTFVAAPQPDPGALEAARARVSGGRLIGTDVFICGPAYRTVRLSLVLAVDVPPSATLRQDIMTGLQTYLDPLVGGDQHDGWPFGEPVRPTALMRVAQALVGSAGDVQSVVVRLDGMTAAESCRDVLIRPHELLALKHVDLRVQQRAAQTGGLR